MTDERAFLEHWYATKFPTATPPTDSTTITFAATVDFLTAYQKADDAKWMMGPSAKHWLESEWVRKFPANPLKRDSVLTVADAEDLLIRYRKGAGG